jgi:DnaJ-class molecular chaperone
MAGREGGNAMTDAEGPQPSRNGTSPPAPQTAENTCRSCGGSGRIGAERCPECGGGGKVVETVGDA